MSNAGGGCESVCLRTEVTGEEKEDKKGKKGKGILVVRCKRSHVESRGFTKPYLVTGDKPQRER